MPDDAVAASQQTVEDLRRELNEALAREAAMAEVLRVINSAPGDLAPVFDAMLEKAMNLCGAAFGILWTYDGEFIHAAASRGVPTAYAEFLAKGPSRITAKDGHGGLLSVRVVEGERVVHVIDLMAEEPYRIGDPQRRLLVDVGGARTALAVALRRDDTLLGLLMIYRQKVQPFSDKQITLLQNFAAQAVIAMENARLITETRDALERQTATAEILQVINSSPTNLQPVFKAIADSAARLCNALNSSVYRFDGQLIHFLAQSKFSPQAVEITRRLFPASPSRDNATARAVADRAAVHIPDVRKDPEYRSREWADAIGLRSVLSVPMVREGRSIGVITVNRAEAGPFPEKQIELLKTFADQAVIAIENTRLITETREALEQQTATAEVLGVINSSPGYLVPVFAVILEKALQLCEAKFGSFITSDGNTWNFVAAAGHPEFEAWTRRAGPMPIVGTTLERLLDGDDIVHIPDVADTEAYRAGVPARRALVDIGGFRTLLNLPLIKDDKVLGILGVYRQEVRPFTEQQIALLQSFAAQAVIAMENARLLGELRERTDDLQESLEYQTATSDVLKVISRTDAKLEAVLDTLVRTAARICAADQGAIHQLRDGLHCVAASCGTTPDYRDYVARNPIKPSRSTAIGRMALERRVIHIEDALIDPEYTPNEFQRLGRFRTMLAVPLLREDAVIGSILLTRTRVEPFTERQIELVRTFADQAVIAIENVRLLDEIRQRQAELRVTFDNMADGVVMFDEHLRLAAWNRNFLEMLDLTDTTLAERPSYSDYLRILAERGEFGTEDIEAELSRRLENTDQEFRTERTRPDGRVMEVRRNAVPDGGFVLIYSDITERKRSEAEIRAARDAAEAAYHDLKTAQASLVQAQKMAALGQLTAGIAHEIKNPLNFVNNFAGLSVELLDELKETAGPVHAQADPDTRAEIDETIDMLTGNLEKIVEHGQRADGIVKGMLEHSRGVTSERRKVDLNNLVEEALNLAYHGARAQDQSFNITLEREYDRDLREIELIPQEVNRVFINLIGNGFYATTKRQREDGGPDFRPTLTVATRDLGEAIEVRIRDNGTGIPAEIKDKLFQPFFTTKPTGEGTGLGLSISYDIVTQQHGGTIEVDSRVGEFTEFTIRLPRGYRATAVEAAS